MHQADRLTKFYGALRAVEDVSFDARPGEGFGLLGPNGSGKSTSVKVRIDRMVSLLDLDEDRRQTLGAYSKGMRQKVLIAAAVLHDPEVFVLDEPFSGLDVGSTRVLTAFVRRLAADGKVVVFSSHEMEIVERVCSRVLILQDGRTVGHDSVENLRAMAHLPSLDAVFAALTTERNVDERAEALMVATKRRDAPDAASA